MVKACDEGVTEVRGCLSLFPWLMLALKARRMAKGTGVDWHQRRGPSKRWVMRVRSEADLHRALKGRRGGQRHWRLALGGDRLSTCTYVALLDRAEVVHARALV